MSTITKERVAEFIKKPLDNGLTRGEQMELARIALASLEAEAVSVTDDMAYSFHHAFSDSSLGADEVEEIKTGLRAAFASVTAPPAPVSVPDELNWEELCQQNPEMPIAHAIIHAASWNACRASMLQGAELVTTAYKLPFEQWLSQQTGTIDVECGCVMTEVFFHWLRVAYEAGNSPVIGEGRRDEAI